MMGAQTLVLSFAFVAATIVAAAVLAQKMLRGPVLTTWFASKSPKRIGVVEQMAIDGKRALVLVRRDDVEHLVMTGGPVDLVIETGIKARNRADEARTAS